MKKKRVLIVEDEEALAKVLKYKLDAAGFITHVATNGEEGLACIKKEQYDIILLDLVMPTLDGFGVLEACKDAGVTTPIFVLSNLGQASDVKTAKELGAKDFFIKSDTQLTDIAKKVTKFLS